MPTKSRKKKLPPDPKNPKRVDPKLGFPPGYRPEWGPSKAMLRAIRARTTESRLLAQAELVAADKRTPQELADKALALLMAYGETGRHDPSRVGALRAVLQHVLPQKHELMGKDGGPIVGVSLDDLAAARAAVEANTCTPPPEPPPSCSPEASSDSKPSPG